MPKESLPSRWLVTTEWLAQRLAALDTVVVDGSFYLPALQRDAGAEYLAGHIPGAVRFDIDAIADHSNPLPHMLPSAEAFAQAVGDLGVGTGDFVVVYDTRGVVSAARVWWTFRAFGHDAIAVLDGGLPKWEAEGRPLESGEAKPARRAFRATPRPERVRDLAAMRDNVTARREQVLDARSAGRFTATEPEPRAGLRGGHIPGSLNLPSDTLLRPDGTLLSPVELRKRFEAAGIDFARPVTTTCGSGITASVLAFALHLLGHQGVAVYDGSWTEWGGRADTPVEP